MGGIGSGKGMSKASSLSYWTWTQAHIQPIEPGLTHLQKICPSQWKVCWTGQAYNQVFKHKLANASPEIRLRSSWTALKDDQMQLNLSQSQARPWLTWPTTIDYHIGSSWDWTNNFIVILKLPFSLLNLNLIASSIRTKGDVQMLD